MICDLISDLHGKYPVLEGGDLLIIAGDCTSRDEPEQWDEFFAWLSKQQYKKKIFIGGNHDNYLELMQELDIVQDEDNSIVYLCDSGTEFEGLKIWGSPYTAQFRHQNPDCMAFSVVMDEQLKDHFDLIPDDTDILITHSPPYGILDECSQGRVGSKSLRETMLRVKPKLHVFGHIHECGGKQIDLVNTICVNASVVDKYYKHVNKPIRVTL